MADVLTTDDGAPWWHAEVRAAREEAHQHGWNEALQAMEDTTRDQLKEGQKVTREDVIRTIRALKDE
jgi:hypothetical protein